MGNVYKKESSSNACSNVSNKPITAKKTKTTPKKIIKSPKPTTKDLCRHRSKNDNVVTSFDSVLTATSSCSTTPCSALSTISNSANSARKYKHRDSLHNNNYVSIHPPNTVYNIVNAPSLTPSPSYSENNLNIPPLRLLPIIKKKSSVSPTQSWSSITNPYSESGSASSSLTEWVLYLDTMGSKPNNVTTKYIQNQEIIVSEPSSSRSGSTCSYNKMSINQSTTPILDDDEVSVDAEK